MAGNNGNGNGVRFSWIAKVLASIVVLGAGSVLGWQLKSAMPRSEVEILKANADKVHDFLQSTNDAQDAQLTLLTTSITDMQKTLAVMEYKLNEALGIRSDNAKR